MFNGREMKIREYDGKKVGVQVNQRSRRSRKQEFWYGER